MADGSVDPPTAPIQRTDNTYTFTDNIYEPIVVKRDYIVIDGAGFNVQGTGNERGIDISGRNHVTIKNTSIKAFSTGVYLYQLSSYNSITGNNITNCSLASLLDYDANFNSFSNNNLEGSISLVQVSSNNKIYSNNFINGGIFLDMVSSNNNISKNNITGGISISSLSRYNAIVENDITINRSTNGIGILLMSTSNNSILRNTFSNGGLSVHDSYGNSVENNSINGKPLVYLENVSNYTVDDAGQVILVNCHDIVVQNLDLSNAGVGIEMLGTNYTEISHNNITNNAGIELRNSASNSISANNITNNGCGIYLMNSEDNSISGNNITNNGNGIQLDSGSNFNAIFGNDIKANTHFGISVGFGINSIFHNNFAENQKHVSPDKFSTNWWDDGIEGNFWSNYTGVDYDQDGIGDSPHVIDAENQDNHPLMGQFYSIDMTFLPGSPVTLVSNSTISDFHVVTVIESIETSKGIPTIFINFTDQAGYGFCRVSIPHALMNISNTPVTIDHGFTTVLNPNYTLYDNSTQRWIYFAYQQSTPPINQTGHFSARIMIIPEFPSFLILPLFIVATLLAIIVYRRNRSIKSRFQLKILPQTIRAGSISL
jgi:parallel beta-helix repeat protein